MRKEKKLESFRNTIFTEQFAKKISGGDDTFSNIRHTSHWSNAIKAIDYYVIPEGPVTFTIGG